MKKRIKGLLPAGTSSDVIEVEATPIERPVSRRSFLAAGAGALSGLLLAGYGKDIWDLIKPEEAWAATVGFTNFGTKEMMAHWWASSPYNNSYGDCYSVIPSNYYAPMGNVDLLLMMNPDRSANPVEFSVVTSSSSYGGTTLKLAKRPMTYRAYGENWATGKQVDYWEAGSGPVMALQGMSAGYLETKTYSGGSLTFKIANAVLGLSPNSGTVTYYDMKVVIREVMVHCDGRDVITMGRWAVNTTLLSSDWVGFMYTYLNMSQLANLFAGGFHTRTMCDINQDGGRHISMSMAVTLDITLHAHASGTSFGTQLTKGYMPMLYNGVVVYGIDDGGCRGGQAFNLMTSTYGACYQPPSTLSKSYAGSLPNITGNLSLVGATGGVATIRGYTSWGIPIYWSDVYDDASTLVGGFTACHSFASSSNLKFMVQNTNTWSIYTCFAGYLTSNIQMVNMGDYGLYASGAGFCERTGLPFANKGLKLVDRGEDVGINGDGTTRFRHVWGFTLDYAYTIKPTDDVDVVTIEAYDRKPTYEEKMLNAVLPNSVGFTNPVSKLGPKWADEFGTTTAADGTVVYKIGPSAASYGKDYRIIGERAYRVHVYTDVPCSITIELVSGDMRHHDQTYEVDGKGVKQLVYLAKKALPGSTLRITVSVAGQHCYWDTLTRTVMSGEGSGKVEKTTFTDNTQIQVKGESNLRNDIMLEYTTRPIYNQPGKEAEWYR